jgi:hypothetical protein
MTKSRHNEANLALTHKAKQALFDWRFSVLKPPDELWSQVTTALDGLNAWEQKLSEKVLDNNENGEES